MDGRGDGDNGSATSKVKGSRSRPGGVERLSPGDVCVLKRLLMKQGDKKKLFLRFFSKIYKKLF